MTTSSNSAGFKIWGLDDVVYGPVDLDTLVAWTCDERIQPDTWIHCVATRRWLPAADMAELRRHFAGLRAAEAALPPELQPEVLRGIKVLSGLSEEQLLRLATFAEVQPFAAYSTIYRVNTPADGLYFLLEGRVRLRITVRGHEVPISVQESGGVFGQISLFDHGPRVTDALADSEVVTIKVSHDNFRKICLTQPDLAVPILLGLGRTLGSRIRSDDKHLCELVAMSQAMQ